ncbi:hypothetical protein BDV98DRAFT_558539 [Pterulicium gracile]|uniref:Uncharacterized protein n=1 Tax=Pterulicium gracile TaxID=1884261 RepID=A0A5C3R4A6_9AGAR|nr:hypothetical protein BDV98DRAFT_558539 [Pterula gracilis]
MTTDHSGFFACVHHLLAACPHHALATSKHFQSSSCAKVRLSTIAADCLRLHNSVSAKHGTLRYRLLTVVTPFSHVKPIRHFLLFFAPFCSLSHHHLRSSAVIHWRLQPTFFLRPVVHSFPCRVQPCSSNSFTSNSSPSSFLCQCDYRFSQHQ